MLRQLWDLGESWWRHDAAVAWSPAAVLAAPEQLDAELVLAIRAALAAKPIVPTISDGRPNWVREVTPDGVWVETERSRALGRPAQLVHAWMIEIAWEYLASHGRLTNRYLLADDGLNVKRSSFVCALLGTLPGVTVSSRRPIELRLDR